MFFNQPQSNQNETGRRTIAMNNHIFSRWRSNSSPALSQRFVDPSLSRGDQIASIDAEILRTEDAIVMLVKQRALLKRRRNELSPAVKLPPEILSLIFQFACSPSSEDAYISPNDNTHGYGASLGLSIGRGAVTPLFLGYVCSAWRNVAHNASQLWDTVTVNVSNKHATAQAAALQDWLTRSGQRPLSIKVIEDDTSANENDDDSGWGIDVTPTALVHILVAHAPRWHTADLFLPSTWTRALAPVRHQLTQLAALTLRFAENSPTMARVDAFERAPRLREVTLVGYTPEDVALPWAQLHRLSGQHFSVAHCLAALRLCPDLRHAEFAQGYHPRVPFAPLPLAHARLESLELLMDNDTSELGAFFGALALPSLTEFVLSLPDDAPLFRDLVPLVRRSVCRLQKLHLVGRTPPEEEVVAALRELPTLKVLLLINPLAEEGGRLGQRFLDFMNPKGRRRTVDTADDDGESDRVDENNSYNTCLLPNLEKLDYQGPIAFPPHALLDMLVARWQVQVSSTPDQDIDMRSPASWDQDARTRNFEEETEVVALVGQQIARLRSVVFTTARKIKFTSAADEVRVQGLMDAGMHLEFLRDPNCDADPASGW